VTSCSDYGGGSQAVENEVEFTYDDTELGALTHLAQQDDGAVSGSSPEVVYAYDTQAAGSGNYQRQTSVTYTSGLEPEIVYGAANSSDDAIVRLTGIEWSDSSTTHDVVAYEYVGMSMPVVVDYALSSLDVQLDYSAAHDGTRGAIDNAGSYPGYDQFGRVRKVTWVDGAFSTHATDNTVPNQPPIVELDYSYDKAGNRTKILDGRPGAAWTNRDHVVTVDDLHRLEAYERGAPGSGGTFAYAAGSQQWTLDFLGNWNALETDVTGDGDYLDTDEKENRDHNLANELTGRDTDDSGGNEITLTFDHAGNLRTSAEGGVTTTYTHDAWNRLVKVQVGSDRAASTRAATEAGLSPS